MHGLPDDSTISDDEVLYRRIPNVEHASFMVVDEMTGVRRPTSAVFRPDQDGLSVYIKSILDEHGLAERDVQTRPESGVLSLLARDIRDEKLGVVRDAWPDTAKDDHPRNAAHALIVGFQSLSKSQLKLTRSALVKKCQVLIDPLSS